MSEFLREHGEYVWVKPQNTTSEFAVPFGARIVRTEKTQTLVCDDANKQFWVPAGDVLKSMHLTSHEDVEDMITLGDLQEYTILRNLQTRYAKQLIYTYTGSMLVAINPYQILPIYTHREIQLYRNKKLNELPPHIFAISDNAFQRLQRHKENQCVVISGESGAGKTESTKLILQYLAAISGKHSWIEQQIIESNPIMEAFGNAKTVRNDNSSRFGKYIDIRFTPDGAIQGARIQQYLLEKSRIVFQSRDERNYHIFYAMLAGLSAAERARLQLEEQSPSQYHYLAQGGCFTLPGKQDAKDFADIRAALKVLSFKPDELWSILSLLAAILHLGNLRFKAIEVANLDTAEVDDNLNLQRVAQLLGLPEASLNTALTQRTIFVHGEHVVTSLSKEAAIEGRDAFVKSLYDGIFVRIVRRINDTIDKKPEAPVNSIGVLDIFGFENFDNNSFEQLCINYANENLQQFFVGHIFKMEQAEYQLEHINWQHIEFQDNQDILDLIGMKPVNIMSLIDEESKFPKGTDQTLLEKLHVQHGNRSMYVKGKTTQTSLFGIRHYAGIVMYNPLGFLEKNRDSFSSDLRNLVQRASNKYLVDIFPHELPMDTTKKQPTLSVKFRNSLDMLMRTLSQAHPYFIRCIKPNEFKEPSITLKKSSSITSVGTIRLPKPVPNNVDTSDFSFQKYASTYFCSGNTSQHERKPLKQPLLKHDLPVEQMAAKAIWLLILRFMEDLPEAAPTPKDHSLRHPQLMQDMARILGSKPRRFIRQTLRRPTKLIGNGQREAEDFYQLWLNAGSSHLDKLHFIIGHGILKESLRDEILAQICKQLYLNPSRGSYARGWLLLSICLSCFPPSSNFEPYLRSYMKLGTAKLHSSSSLQHLERTLANGARSQPPSLLELQSIRNKEPLKLAIYLMDGEARKLQVDAASTAREAVQQLCDGLGLSDSFGFGLVLSFQEKLMPLGAGREHVLDAISSCEQRDLDSPWKLYLRKELFDAWYDPAQDPKATHLIYKQVVLGLKCGEYRCRSEKDIAMVCALACYIEHGAGVANALNEQQLTEFVPRDLLAPGERAVQNWSRLVAATYERSAYVKKGQDALSQQRAKEDICLFAHLSWPMRHSRLYEVQRLSGPKLQSDELMLAVNASGLSLIDETEQVLASCTYAELVKVQFEAQDQLHVRTVQHENFVLQCSEALDAAELINYMLLNLQQRSSYAVAIEGCEAEQQLEEQLLLSPGDLVQFEAGVTGGQLLADDVRRPWRGSANGQTGEFAAGNVRVLATLTRPSLALQQVFKEHTAGAKVKSIKQELEQPVAPKRRQHSLAQFAEQQFRENLDSELAPLWRYSPEPLKAPLLKSLHSQPQLYQQALVIYHHIQKYMGDIPRGQLAVNTDLIFQAALHQPLLCDELFCQLMKQLTGNTNVESEQRGWDLLYLATGIMVPSVLIMRELILLLRLRADALADACLKRLKRSLQHGQRKQPPHLIEVEGIQQRCMHIYHKIYFPDDTVEAFEIESHTRGAALITDIAQRLELKSQLGYSIFLKIGEKVYAMPEEEFVFDYITELLHFVRQQKSIRASCDAHYQLHFMRKLWLDSQPGNDINADLIFSYPQELHKYLKGYYAVDLEQSLQLAQLIYSADQQRDEALQLQELVPEDLLPQRTLAVWQQQLLPLLEQSEQLEEDQAKLLLLQQLAKQPCYGSTFFAVKQLNDSSLPEHLLIAINCDGLQLLDAQTKQLLHSYSYADLGIWSSGKNHFHIRFGNMIGASKLLCSTNQGYKMDDLLTSYMRYFNR
ncbi:myosin-VIIa isoform X2 [Drosophila sulfurigaster albostrigata]|uniref:myosin-VIIa isoform X2 n=1 Tax=Drosophila sulfurigaster albostrigata TaxID=89887 RepID=UPI002D218EC3|nr:myosin-VIIa isoform X2 [Drosophila sulfurigaster albostrigata]